MTSNAELFSAAQAVIPGGVDSPVRAYGSVGGVPRFIEKAQGPWIWDAEGTRYVDLVCTWGPALLGHARPEVVSAVQEAASKGLSFGAPTRTETELADAIIERMDPVEKVRFVSTGTEATMTAVRLARGATGRDVIVKFAGNYHGHSDALLAAAGSGVATAGLPGSAGVPAASTADTIVVDYNDVAALDAVFSERGDQIAAVIVESCPANMGVVPPEPGFNAAIRRLTTEHGALMITDEVLTGFRCSPSGFWGLQQQAGEDFAPDIFTFGKVVGGGMPLAALGGTPMSWTCWLLPAPSTRPALCPVTRWPPSRVSKPYSWPTPRCISASMSAPRNGAMSSNPHLTQPASRTACRTPEISSAYSSASTPRCAITTTPSLRMPRLTPRSSTRC